MGHLQLVRLKLVFIGPNKRRDSVLNIKSCKFPKFQAAQEYLTVGIVI